MRVLSYHGVVDRLEQVNYFSSLFTDITNFEEQVALLARRARTVSLAEFGASLADGRPLPEDAVHVSIDDGFRNNLRAAEILDRHGIPWSLFVIVDAVLDGYRPWFVRMADAIHATTNVMLRDGSVFEMSGRGAKRRFARMAKARIMSSPDANQDRAVDAFLALRGMVCPPETSWPFLETAELRELHTAGVEIGNHSRSHRNLVRCPDADLEAEVVAGKVRLEDVLGGPIRHFAYPDGRNDRRVRRLVGAHHVFGLATWSLRPSRLALRRYEPLDTNELAAILETPEPWYGIRWARWTVPARVREAAHRLPLTGGGMLPQEERMLRP